MSTVDRSTSEAFQPIPVHSPTDAPLRFALRCAVDLQLLTIHRFLRGRLGSLQGRLLDVGAGEAPWRDLVAQTEYIGIDVEAADRFGMRRNASVVYYDGRTIPFPDASFDHVLCVEVLEHVEEPRALIRDIARVLRTQGTLVLTVPWSARLHHLPHDYHRFSRYALQALLAGEGFREIEIEERGNDVAVVANKLLVMTVRLARSRRGIAAPLHWLLALLVSPLVGLFLVAAHVAMAIGTDGASDPLGYGVAAKRS